MICRKCNKEVPDTPFCPFCGAKQEQPKLSHTKRGNGQSSGREYIYFDVSISEYFSFINAPSVGKYYNKHIRQKYHSDFVGIKNNETPKPTNPT